MRLFLAIGMWTETVWASSTFNVDITIQLAGSPVQQNCCILSVTEAFLQIEANLQALSHSSLNLKMAIEYSPRTRYCKTLGIKVSYTLLYICNLTDLNIGINLLECKIYHEEIMSYWSPRGSLWWRWITQRGIPKKGPSRTEGSKWQDRLGKEHLGTAKSS